jgi:hypothetical protein
MLRGTHTTTSMSLRWYVVDVSVFGSNLREYRRLILSSHLRDPSSDIHIHHPSAVFLAPFPPLIIPLSSLLRTVVCCDSQGFIVFVIFLNYDITSLTSFEYTGKFFWTLWGVGLVLQTLYTSDIETCSRSLPMERVVRKARSSIDLLLYSRPHHSFFHFVFIFYFQSTGIYFLVDLLWVTVVPICVKSPHVIVKVCLVMIILLCTRRGNVKKLLVVVHLAEKSHLARFVTIS